MESNKLLMNNHVRLQQKQIMLLNEKLFAAIIDQDYGLMADIILHRGNVLREFINAIITLPQTLKTVQFIQALVAYEVELKSMLALQAEECQFAIANLQSIKRYII
jgi:hypothetical protein